MFEIICWLFLFLGVGGIKHLDKTDKGGRRFAWLFLVVSILGLIVSFVEKVIETV